MMLEDQGISSSSSDEEILEERRLKPKNQDYFEVTVPQYSEAEFFEHFRVSRRVATEIANRFEQSEQYCHQSGEYGKLSAYEYSLIFLWFAGHEAASYRDEADRFGIALSTLRKIVERMIYFLSNLSPTVITWPTLQEQLLIKQEFSVNGFPGVVGVIDESHVRIDKPSEDPDSYLNRKGFYSMQFQVVCDHRRKIRDVFVGFPGSVHDSRVFRASPLSRSLQEKFNQNYLLGDSGYPCLRHLLTPFKDLGNLTRRQQNYNVKLAKTRYRIEHCFGILKQKFRQLFHLKLRGDHDISNFIRAACVLHNLALEDDFPLMEDELPPTVRQENMQEHNLNLPEDERDDRDGNQFRTETANNLPLI